MTDNADFKKDFLNIILIRVIRVNCG